jgi:replicative DNA helicase
MVHSGLKCQEKELPIDPYVLGVWLGGGTESSVTNGLDKQLRLSGIIEKKHIPSEYFTSSHQQRIDLLRGIMDSGGYYNKVRKRYVITTPNKNMAHDYETLISTFGVKVTIIKHKGRYDVCFWIDEYPFRARKVDVNAPLVNRHTFRTIKSIEKVETVKTKCIEVDSETHTYLATKKLIVTHNTNKDLTNEYNRTYGNMLLPPFDNMYDESLSHYKIQLNLYALALEQLGYKMAYKIIVWLKEDGTYEKIPVGDITEQLRHII